MKLYLDMCALKRPFDDQTQERVAAEAFAVVTLLDRIERGVDQSIWSTALTLENDADPDAEVRMEVAKFADRAAASLRLTTQIEARINELTAAGLRPLDAAHVAFAEAEACDVLITCDDRLLRQAARVGCLIRVMNPLEYMREVGHAESNDR